MADRLTKRVLVIAAPIIVAAVFFSYKVDLLRRTSTILYSSWLADYRQDYSKDPLFKDRNAAIWIFVTHRNIDEVQKRYEHLFGYTFTGVRNLPTTASLCGRGLSFVRGVVGGGGFNYVSLAEIQWKDRDSGRELLIVCGDNSIFGWGYGR